MSGNSSKAIKAGLGYTIGNVLIKGISFLTLPLFSRLMTTNEFGIYNVFLSYEAILFVIIGLAIHTSIRSANIEFRNEIDRYTSSVTLIYFLNLVILNCIVLLFGDTLGRLMGFPKVILFLLVLYSFGSAVLALYNNRIALDYAYNRYLIVALINTVTNIGISLVFMLTICKDSKDMGRILGVTISLFSLSSILVLSFFRHAKPKIVRKYWKFAVEYSLPIVPHGISQVLLAQFDRIMIRSMVSDSAAGIYSLPANIKLVLTIISDSISTAWSTWFYEEYEKGHSEKIQKRAKQLCCMFAIFSLGLIALSPELVIVLGGKNYFEGRFVAVPMVADAFILFVYVVIVQVEYYEKKTVFVMLGTIFATILNLITNYVFIKRYGYIAAAYTTLFSYMVYLLIHIIISRVFAGYFVLELKWLLLFGGLICLLGSITIMHSDSILLRYALCLLVIIPLASWLFADYRHPNKYNR